MKVETQPRPAQRLHACAVPHFMIIGAAKAGTTSLYDDLARHPDAFLPSLKEPDILHLGATPQACAALYGRHFAGAPHGKCRGEASTYYTMLPTYTGVAERALQTCGPDLKLVYMMRDPVARIRSHLAHDYAVGRLRHTDFDAAIRNDPRYTAWSDYPMQAAPWITAFGRAQILFVSFDRFVAERAQTVREVCAHIGLDPSRAQVGEQASNTRGTQRQARFGVVESLLGSATFRHVLRPLLPRGVRSLGKMLLTRKRPQPAIRLSPETEAALRAAFADQNEKLAALGIHTFPSRAEPA